MTRIHDWPASAGAETSHWWSNFESRQMSLREPAGSESNLDSETDFDSKLAFSQPRTGGEEGGQGLDARGVGLRHRSVVQSNLTYVPAHPHTRTGTQTQTGEVKGLGMDTGEGEGYNKKPEKYREEQGQDDRRQTQNI